MRADVLVKLSIRQAQTCSPVFAACLLLSGSRLERGGRVWTMMSTQTLIAKAVHSEANWGSIKT